MEVQLSLGLASGYYTACDVESCVYILVWAYTGEKVGNLYTERGFRHTVRERGYTWERGTLHGRGGPTQGKRWQTYIQKGDLHIREGTYTWERGLIQGKRWQTYTERGLIRKRGDLYRGGGGLYMEEGDLYRGKGGTLIYRKGTYT